MSFSSAVEVHWKTNWFSFDIVMGYKLISNYSHFVEENLHSLKLEYLVTFDFLFLLQASLVLIFLIAQWPQGKTMFELFIVNFQWLIETTKSSNRITFCIRDPTIKMRQYFHALFISVSRSFCR